MWAALFTCLPTRAVYLDISLSMSAEAFLLCMRRFMSFYKPCRMYSDNGTNFVGGERLLREELERFHASQELAAFHEEKSDRVEFPTGTDLTSGERMKHSSGP